MSVMERDHLLFQGADWDFGTIQRIHDAVEAIGVGEMGLDVYPNQIEVITAEQMLDAYASIGMPLFAMDTQRVLISGLFNFSMVWIAIGFGTLQYLARPLGID